MVCEGGRDEVGWGKIEINSFVFSSYERIERVVREPRNRMEIRVLN